MREMSDRIEGRKKRMEDDGVGSKKEDIEDDRIESRGIIEDETPDDDKTMDDNKAMEDETNDNTINNNTITNNKGREDIKNTITNNTATDSKNHPKQSTLAIDPNRQNRTDSRPRWNQLLSSLHSFLHFSRGEIILRDHSLQPLRVQTSGAFRLHQDTDDSRGTQQKIRNDLKRLIRGNWWLFFASLAAREPRELESLLRYQDACLKLSDEPRELQRIFAKNVGAFQW